MSENGSTSHKNATSKKEKEKKDKERSKHKESPSRQRNLQGRISWSETKDAANGANGAEKKAVWPYAREISDPTKPAVPPKRETAKLIILGAQGVGKSTILAQQSGAYLSDRIQPTIGLAYSETTVCVKEKAPEKKGGNPVPVNVELTLKCFDTAGQERFKSVVHSYYRDVAAALIVYDVTRVDSFQDLKAWTDELKKRSTDQVVFCVVGNKLDLSVYRRVDRWTAEYFASSIGASYYETSAFRNTGINEAFQGIAKDIVSRGLGKPVQEGEEEPRKKKKGCCKTG